MKTHYLIRQQEDLTAKGAKVTRSTQRNFFSCAPCVTFAPFAVKPSLFLPLLLLLLLTHTLANSQYVPVHPNSSIYTFLDELNNNHQINFNSLHKPLSRKEISNLLNETDLSKLNTRQQKELNFYLKDYNKEVYLNKNFDRRLDLLYHRDSLFTITVNPILGGNYWSNENGTAYHWWNGAEAWGTLGRWAFYGSLRDNHESEYLSQPEFLNQNPGGANFKRMSDGKVDFWEYRGGVSYDFGVGDIGIYKDHFEWGNNYHGSNIFSGRTPSFAHIALNIKPVKWFEFHYVHGWLVSEVIDSTRSFYVNNSYGRDFRERYHGKFLASNIFSFLPFQRFNISFGNSIIYDYDNAHPAYFIPVMFYKAVDHGLSSGIDNMNSQLFFDISSRNIKHTHLFATLFIDEMAVDRIFDPDEHNFYSFKGGVRISNLIPNAYAGIEYTISNALVFRHYVSTLSFESNRYNLGHYLADNAKELYLCLGFQPFRNMDMNLSYTKAMKGPDHTMLGTPRTTVESFTPVVWESTEINLQASWQIINDLHIRLGYSWRNVEGEQEYIDNYTPEFWQGKTGTLSVGVNVGF